MLEFPPGTTWFGLEIVQDRLVRLTDIEALPFYDFWLESAKGSTMPVIDDAYFVYLHDWVAFCERFVRTGGHRFGEG